MKPTNQRYDELLTSLFDVSKPLPVPATCHIRFIAERNRRMLSISRTMSHFWPNTLRFEQALQGRSFVEGVAAEIPHLINIASSMEDAIEAAGLRWHDKTKQTTSRELFRFEQFQRNMHGLGSTAPTRQERSILKEMGVMQPKVLDFSIDVLMLVRSISYLENNFASADNFSGIVPPPQTTRLAFGLHNNKRVVVVLPRRD